MSAMSSRLVSAAKWSVLAQVSLYGARLIPLLIVPRYLGPSDYGVFGFALLFVTLFQLLIESVIPMAVVQSARPVAAIARTATVGAFAVAIGGYAVLSALAIPAGRWLGDGRVSILFPIMGAQLFLSALYAIRVAVLQRELDFRRLFLVRAFGVVPAVACTIVLAVTGHGYWALVLGWLSGGAGQAAGALLVVSLPKGAGFEWSRAKDLHRFSKWVALDIGANWALEYGAGLFIGTMLGAAALGKFRLADQIVRAVCAVVLDPLTPVVYSAMSMLRRSGEEIGAALPRLNHVFGTISIPLSGIFILAGGAISILLGAKWHGTGAIFALDALVWGINYLVQAVPQFFRALGRPALVALVRVPLLLVQVLILLVVTRGGVVPFLFGRITVELTMIALTGVVLKKAAGLSLFRLLQRHTLMLVLIPLCLGVSYLSGMIVPADRILLQSSVRILVFATLALAVASRDSDSYLAHLRGSLNRSGAGWMRR